MSWINFLDKIYLVNLLKRSDRLLVSAQDCEKYGIPYERFNAIEDEQGARGLRDSMLQIFNEAIEKDYKNILVLEDDFQIIVSPEVFNATMDNVVQQLPENYHLCFLGGQASNRFSHFHSPNLLPVTKYFSTHSVIYSQQGIREILARGMGYPIDNWMVDKIQPLGCCYTVHPLLCSQYPGFSNIGGNVIDWTPFIVPRHEQKIAEMNNKGRKW